MVIDVAERRRSVDVAAALLDTPDVWHRVEPDDLAPLARCLRKARGLMRSDVVAGTGLSGPYLSQLETGARRGSWSVLTRWLAAFDVEIAIVVRRRSAP